MDREVDPGSDAGEDAPSGDGGDTSGSGEDIVMMNPTPPEAILGTGGPPSEESVIDA